MGGMANSDLIAVLLLATTVQAVHLCCLELPNLQVTLQARTGSFGGGACLTCLMAHSAAATLPAVIFSPTSGANRERDFSQVQSRQLLQSFQLYVRPPPVC